jgi:hypothetical protein
LVLGVRCTVEEYHLASRLVHGVGNKLILLFLVDELELLGTHSHFECRRTLCPESGRSQLVHCLLILASRRRRDIVSSCIQGVSGHLRILVGLLLPFLWRNPSQAGHVCLAVGYILLLFFDSILVAHIGC